MCTYIYNIYSFTGRGVRIGRAQAFRAMILSRNMLKDVNDSRHSSSTGTLQEQCPSCLVVREGATSGGLAMEVLDDLHDDFVLIYFFVVVHKVSF